MGTFETPIHRAPVKGAFIPIATLFKGSDSTYSYKLFRSFSPLILKINLMHVSKTEI